MNSKEEIVNNWLPRYTGVPLEAFGDYILLTNFIGYVELFAEKFQVEIMGKQRPMQTATKENITIINSRFTVFFKMKFDLNMQKILKIFSLIFEID